MLEKLKSYYILIEPGDTFGVVDVIASDKLESEVNVLLDSEDSDSTNNSEAGKAAKAGPREKKPRRMQAQGSAWHNRNLRKFTVQCIEEAEFIMLSLD